MPYSAWAETRRNLFDDTLAADGSATNWNGSPIVPVQVSGDAFGRTFAMRATTTASGAQRFGGKIALATSTLYTVRFRARASMARSTWQVTYRNNPTGANVAIATGVTIDENVSEYEYTFTSPASGIGSTSGMYLVNVSGNVAEWVEIADLEIELGDKRGFGWIGGPLETDLKRIYWDGAANLSDLVQTERSFTYPAVAPRPKPLAPEDILVEFRDKDLVRQGSIPLDDLQLKMQPVVNGVGSWSLTLPAEHRAVPYLRTPGAGILVTNLRTGETLLSGPTSKPSKRATSADPAGMVTVAGLTDDRLLWDALAFPNPAIADPLASSQSRANDVRTGKGEALMRKYVAYNICYTHAQAGRLGGFRSKLRLEAVDNGLGFSSSRRPRFDILGDLLVGIAAEQGLAFRVVQIGAELQFQVYQPTDRTATIRLDIKNGTLQEQNVEFAPPEVTRMVVAGQGEGTERQFLQMSTTDSTAAEAEWGLIIEEFKDQRNTDVESELEAAALERLNEAGFTKIAVKATPANETTMIFMKDFFLGDKVSVVIDGQEQPNSHITEAAIVVDSTGIRTAVAIGDIADFDSDSALRQTVSDTQRRVDNLERNAEAMSPSAMESALFDVIHPVGSIYMTTVATNPATVLGHGTWVAWGSGRVPVGVNTGDTDFNTVEKTGGAKTVTLTAAQSGLPQHTHVQDAHNHTQNSHNHTQNAHSHGAPANADGFAAHRTNSTGGYSAIFSSGSASEVFSYWLPAAAKATNNAATATNNAATAVNQNAGPADASQAHPNVQPYITCYMFKRTA